MGLDVRIVMAKNTKQVELDSFWDNLHEGWIEDETEWAAVNNAIDSMIENLGET